MNESKVYVKNSKIYILTKYNENSEIEESGLGERE